MRIDCIEAIPIEWLMGKKYEFKYSARQGENIYVGNSREEVIKLAIEALLDKQKL